MKSLDKLINKIEKKIENPSKGLPEDIFRFISRITPLINVDLLIQNKKKRNFTNLEKCWREICCRLARSRRNNKNWRKNS